MNNMQILELITMGFVICVALKLANSERKENTKLLKENIEMSKRNVESLERNVELLKENYEIKEDNKELLKDYAYLLVEKKKLLNKINKRDEIIAFDNVVLGKRMCMIECLTRDSLSTARRHFKDLEKIVDLEEQNRDFKKYNLHYRIELNELDKINKARLEESEYLRKEMNRMKKYRKIRKAEKLEGVR